jgi:hypothetical protein
VQDALPTHSAVPHRAFDRVLDDGQELWHDVRRE